MITKDLQVRRLIPSDKQYKKSVEKGLFILIKPDGSKYWRFAYRFGGKQKTLAFGVYPEVTLKEAKEKRDRARKQVAEGIDPSMQRKMDKLTNKYKNANSFELVAREWHEKQSSGWSQSHAKKLLTRLENDIFPWIGQCPIAEIKPIEMLETVRRIEQRGAIESAHRALQTCGQVCRYGVATGRAERDICADLRGALSPYRKKHYAAIIDPVDLAPLLRDIKNYKGSLITRIAFQMLPYVFVRSGDLRCAEWSEVDFNAKLWIIPSQRMKVKSTGIDHIVPLSNQVIELLNELKPLTSTSSKYIFQGARSVRRPMSENTVCDALRSLGYTKDQMTPHGFRATARTLLDEVLDYPAHLIEHQLAHTVKDSNGRAYNRTKHLDQRREMMQTWADYLDKLAEGDSEK